MYARILVPLDGSLLAEAILPHVEALAKATGAEVVLLRVPLYPLYEITAGSAAYIESLHDTLESEATNYLLDRAEHLRERGLNVSFKLRNGSVPRAILDAVDEVGADLIAMSTHGRGGVARWVMGSVADEVVHEAKIPVLLVRPSAEQLELKPAAAPERQVA